MFITLLTSNSFTQINTPASDSALSYYPLETGMKWVYHLVRVYNWSEIYESDMTREILGDTVLNDGLQYKITKVVSGIQESYSFFRIDSATGLVTSQNSEWPFFLTVDLFLNLGDTLSQYGGLTFAAWDSFNKWGINSPQRKYLFTNALNECCYNLTKSIGFDSIVISAEWDFYTYTLKGIVMSGIVYGDTTVITSTEAEIVTPGEFSLSQNYPNPFNPSTRINYIISEYSDVVIKVFDILGNEIAKLVNEEKPAGEYEIMWNAAEVPSGVYFYQLRAGDFVETKKMILMK